MTDRIDLDELSGTDEEETGTGSRGDWLWREGESGDDTTRTAVGRCRSIRDRRSRWSSPP